MRLFDEMLDRGERIRHYYRSLLRVALWHLTQI
jgi:hypothetical protein